MQGILIEYIYLILLILGLVMIANRLRIAYPIALVLGGLALSLTGEVSHVAISPEVVFFVFLPPLLYEAAWQVSWKEFWKWRRAITSFAFPIVILTSCVIAIISSWLIPGFTLALGFLLGGIISPPDAVSASSIMRRIHLPKSIVSIAEGESLLNDASALIVFRFALIAVVSGQFHLSAAVFSFLIVIFMGSLIGVLVGTIFYAVHRWLPTTTSIDVVLTLLTPYCMYYSAEHFHFSGVLAVVTGGLFLSSKRQSMLTYQSRIQGVNVWTNLVFVLNGLIFLLIGMQLRSIYRQLGDVRLESAMLYGLLIALVLIITRLLCTLGASVFTRFMSRFITVADPNPGWRMPLILGWAGMRGVVSLAAALSVPISIKSDQPFPYRNLILFITFVVILVTLVFQGLTLPWLIRKVKPSKYTMPEEDQEKVIQRKLTEASLQFLEEKYGKERGRNLYLGALFTRLQADLNFFDQQVQRPNDAAENEWNTYGSIYLDLLDHQRKLINEMNRFMEFDEELIRKYLLLADMEEFKIHQQATAKAERL